MKHLKRLLSIALCFVITFSAVAGTVGAANYGVYYYDIYRFDYPLCQSFIDSLNKKNGFKYWYYNEYMQKYDSLVQYNSFLSYFSEKWFDNYCFGDSEEICPEYLEKFRDYLGKPHTDSPPIVTSDGTYLFDCRVDSYEYNGDTLSVKCSADYDITYYCVFDDYYGAYVYIVGAYSVRPYVVVTDKFNGDLVNVGMVKDFRLNPEFRYRANGRWFIDDDEYPLDADLKKICGRDERINYTCTTSSEFDLAIPDFYDAEKHDLSIYFRINTADYDYGDIYVAWRIDDQFYNPTVLTRDDVPEPPVSSETEPVEPPVSSETEPVEPPVSSETEPVEPPVSSEIVTPEPPAPEIVRGDADGSGALDLLDVTLTLKYLAEWEGITLDKTAADISGNDKVNLSDVSLMLQIIAGWNV